MKEASQPLFKKLFLPQNRFLPLQFICEAARLIGCVQPRLEDEKAFVIFCKFAKNTSHWDKTGKQNFIIF